MDAELLVILICQFYNYIITSKGIAAITWTNLFMKSSHLKSTVPPVSCLQHCQQASVHIVFIQSDVIAAAFHLPLIATHSDTQNILNCGAPLYVQ